MLSVTKEKAVNKAISGHVTKLANAKRDVTNVAKGKAAKLPSRSNVLYKSYMENSELFILFYFH